MGLIKTTLFAAGALGVAMLHFGRDSGLPADRIGREPTIAQETIEPVSAAVQDAGMLASPETAKGEVIATANAAIADAPQAAFAASPVALENTAPAQTPAELAEEAARLMASWVGTPQPASPAIAPSPSSLQSVFVSGSSVNMRSGPSTQHGVVARLSRGTEVIDMGPAGSGWSQIKVVATGDRGFMASKFLKTQL